LENFNSRGCAKKIKTIEELKEKLINLREHECFCIDERLLSFLTNLGLNFEEPQYDDLKKLKFLGLFLTSKSPFKVCTHYFVGAGWLVEGEIPIRIFPKDRNGKIPDYLKMYLKLLEDEEIITNTEFQNVFKVDIEKPLIEVKEEDKRFLYLVVFAYLSLLKRLVKKGLKKGFLYKEQNLNGRIKGKLDIKLTTQRFFSKTKYTRTVCKFETLTENILENQILKTALIQAEKFLKEFPFKGEDINYLIGYLKKAFWRVSTVKVYEKDFLKVKKSPFFPEYRNALKLAQIILKNLGIDPFLSFKGISYITPYIINMPKLFELYVWKKLKEKYGADVKYQVQKGGDIPDFIVNEHNLIVDAKYKYLDLKKVSKEDICQIARYGRNIDIRKLVSYNEDLEPELCIAYPTFEENEKKEQLKDYFKFFKLGVKIPFN